MRGHRGLEQCAGGHMEADEWERTACGEIKREKHFWGEKFVSPLGLCCFFLAALAVFFRSPLVSLTFLLFPPAVEDWKTGYVSDHWSVFLAAAGLGHNVFYSRLTDGFISCAFVLGMYGLLFLLAKHAMGAGDIFLSGAAALWLLPVSVPLFLFLSASSAAMAGMVLIFFGRMSRREGIPFCPFIALGGVAAYGAEVFQLPFFPSWHCFI